jgi:hypothetical protein
MVRRAITLESERELNRIRKKDVPDEPPAGDYYVVGTPRGYVWIDAPMASRLGKMLSRLWPVRWLRLVDRNGSRIWMRAGWVQYVQESTEGQRERSRAFHRARDREARADRDWDDEDW